MFCVRLSVCVVWMFTGEATGNEGEETAKEEEEDKEEVGEEEAKPGTHHRLSYWTSHTGLSCVTCIHPEKSQLSTK